VISAEETFMTLLQKFNDRNQNLSHKLQAYNYASREFSKLPRDERRDYGEADLRRAMNTLLNNEKVRIVGCGRTKDRNQKIIPGGG
jgi:hypothetical protein